MGLPIKSLGVLLVLLCILPWVAHSAPQVFEADQFGIKGDGVVKNTESIAKAIQAASAAPGGGVVHFSKGTYLTGPIHLRSDVTLQLDAGVVVKFSDDFDDYLPLVPVRWQGSNVLNFSPQIYGQNLNNVAIKGDGIFDGNGPKWWKVYWALRDNQTTDWTGSKWQSEFVIQNQAVLAELKEDNTFLAIQNYLRPPMFQLMHSQNVRLEGVTFRNSPFWTVHPTYCDYVTIDRVTVDNPEDVLNTDCINPDSCRHVHISNCHLASGDDAVAIKSGMNKQARTIGRPSENITITDCVFTAGHGGITLGSDASGGIHGVVARNIHIENLKWGFYIRTLRGRGGVIENVLIQNVTMKNMTQGLTIDFFEYGQTAVEAFSERTPVIRDFHFEDIRGEANTFAINLVGITESHLQNFSLRNVHITSHQGIVLKEADNVRLENVSAPLWSN